MLIDLTTEKRPVRKETVRNIKILGATHYAIYVNNVTDEIAAAVNITPKTVLKWTKTAAWKEACEFWEYKGDPIIPCDTPREVQLRKNARHSLLQAERFWRYIIHKGYDLYPHDMENDPKLAYFYPDPVRNQYGIERITPFSRVRDWILTARYRVKHLLWKLYVAVCI